MLKGTRLHHLALSSDGASHPEFSGFQLGGLSRPSAAHFVLADRVIPPTTVISCIVKRYWRLSFWWTGLTFESEVHTKRLSSVCCFPVGPISFSLNPWI